MMSDFEEEIFEFLKVAFPRATIFPQHPVKFFGEQLFIDFYIPAMSLAVECQGEQHYSFTPHFHGDKEGFKASVARDNNKREWARKNNVFLLEIPFNDRPRSAGDLFNRISAGFRNAK
jgi:hypothetical protein